MPFLVFIVFSVMAAFAILLPSIMYYLQNLGASKAEATQILAIYSLMQFFAGPALGRLSDKIGRKPVLLFALSGSIIAYSHLSLLVDSLIGVVLVLALAGLSAGSVAVIFASAADASTPDRRSAHMGMLGAGIGAAFTIGPMVGAFVGKASADAATLHFPAMASSVLLVAGALVAWFWKPVILDASAEKPADAPSEILKPLQFVADKPLMVVMCVMLFLFTLSLASMEPILPYLMKDRFAWGPRDMGSLMAYGGLIVILVQGGLVGRLTKRYGEQKLITWGITLMACGFIIIASLPVVWATFVGLTLTGMGGSIFTTSLLALGSKQAGSEKRGLVMGALQSMQSFGRSVGPLGAGFLYQVSMVLPLVFGVLLMLVVWGLRPMMIRKLATAEGKND